MGKGWREFYSSGEWNGNENGGEYFDMVLVEIVFTLQMKQNMAKRLAKYLFELLENKLAKLGDAIASHLKLSPTHLPTYPPTH